MTKSDKIRIQPAARRALDRADALYQFGICLGLAIMAGFVGTAGAFMVHTGL
jgi:hypothetical protein